MCEWESEEKQCIDKLFNWLFDLVPVNLYKLSCLADEWSDIDDISMFIEYFSKIYCYGIYAKGRKFAYYKKIIKSQKTY